METRPNSNRLTEASEKVREGLLEEALAIYDQILSTNHSDPAALSAKADLFSKWGQYDQAIAFYDAALALEPRSVTTLRSKAAALTRLRRFREALSLHEEVLRIEPGSTPTWVDKGDALIELGRYSEAISCYEQAASVNPFVLQAEDWSIRGDTLYKHKQYAEAAACYRKALDTNKGYFWAWRGLGLTFAAQDKKDAALDCFEKAKQIEHPNNVLAWIDEAQILIERREYCTANATLDGALKKIQITLLRGWKRGVQAEMGRYEDAIACYDEVIKARADDNSAWQGKGFCLNRLGLPEEAIKCYDVVLQLDHGSLWARNNKGWSYIQLGRYQEALTELDEAIRIDPTQYLPWVNNSRCFRELKDFEAGRKCLEDALGVIGEHRMLLIALGQLFGDYLNDIHRALGLYKRALQLAPNDALAMTNIAECLIRVKEYRDARNYVASAIDVSEDRKLTVICRFLALMCCSLEGDRAEQKTAFDEFIRSFVSHKVGPISSLRWDFGSLTTVVTSVDADLETKFLLLTLIDLLSERRTTVDLTFFERVVSTAAHKDPLAQT
jgi:tetratricopeptide (TPR) repeat protein